MKATEGLKGVVELEGWLLHIKVSQRTLTLNLLTLNLFTFK